MNYTSQNIARRFNLFYDFQECKKRGKYWRNFKFTQAVELMSIVPPFILFMNSLFSKI